VEVSVTILAWRENIGGEKERYIARTLGTGLLGGRGAEPGYVSLNTRLDKRTVHVGGKGQGRATRWPV